MGVSCRPLFIYGFRIFIIGVTVVALWAMEANAIENSSRVISPYWQSDSASYTFIAVTHPSLTDIASQVGVQINAIQNDKAAFATAVSFTISAGATQRVFIVRSGHTLINSTIIPSALFIVGTTDFKYGNLLITPIASNPEIISATNDGDGFRDITMLFYFGGIVFDASTTGFSMEFIGDVKDSAAHSNMHNTATVSGVN